MDVQNPLNSRNDHEVGHGINPSTISWDKPSTVTKFAYAIPYLAVSAMMAPMTVELKIFYTDTVLVPAGLLALAIAIARAFDALTDPLMGWISDSTRTSWGRRKPWFPVGVVGSALFFWLLFSPPAGLSPQKGAIWAGLAFLLYYLFHTIWAVPYHALGMELTPDYDDRTRVFGLRALASGLGLVLAFVFLLYIKQKQIFPDERQMLSVFVGSLCILMVVLFIMPVCKIKEHPEFSRRKGTPLIPGIRAAIRNKPFKVLITVYVLMSVTATLPPLLMPYFSKYILVLGPLYRVGFALVYVVATFISLPGWMAVAGRFGKEKVWSIASFIGILTSIVVFFVGEGQVFLMGAMEFIRGVAAGAVMVAGPAMLADIVDYDELLTGKRREAQFGSFMTLVPKFVAIFSATLPLAVLGIVGYNPVLPSQTEATLLAIRGLYALLPITFHIIILLVIRRYPITRKVHEAIRCGIDVLKQKKRTRDPISGKDLIPIQPEDEDTAWFLDNFSTKELRQVTTRGPANLKNGIIKDVFICGGICVLSIIFTIRMLSGSLSMSEADQFKQGVGSCIIVVAGLALTLMVFHVMRIPAAAKMATDPIDTEVIKNHIANL